MLVRLFWKSFTLPVDNRLPLGGKDSGLYFVDSLTSQNLVFKMFGFTTSKSDYYEFVMELVFDM